MATYYTSEKINKNLDALGLNDESVLQNQKNILAANVSYNYPSEFGCTEPFRVICGSLAEGFIMDEEAGGSDIDIQHIFPCIVVPPGMSSNLPTYFPAINSVFELENSKSHTLFKRLKYIRGKHMDSLYKHQNGDQYLSHAKLAGKRTLVSVDEDISKLTKIVSSDLSVIYHTDSDNVKVDLTSDRSGPSISYSFQSSIERSNYPSDLDTVTVLPCPYWPSDLMEWFTRERNFLWPSKANIDLIKSNGCRLVSKGFLNSEEFDIEWAVSFTMAELCLIKSFNETQRKCLYLMKRLHKKHIKPKFKDTLSSYHLKTTMFWVLEEKEQSHFHKDGLLRCFFMCIDRLIHFLIQKNCPLYFLPSVNLFLNKVPQQMCEQIGNFLQDYKQKSMIIFYRNLEVDSLCYSTPEATGSLNIAMHGSTFKLEQMRKFVDSISHLSLMEIQDACSETLENFTKIYYYVLRLNISVIEELFFDLILDLLIIKFSAATGHINQNKRQYGQLPLQLLHVSAYWSPETCAANLKRATAFYKLGRLNQCERIVSNVIHVLSNTRSVLIGSHQDIMNDKMHFIIRNSSNFDQCLCPNITFSPLERCLVPQFIQEEMDIEKIYDSVSWQGWAFVDSIIYAYYLGILCWHEVSYSSKRDRYLNELEVAFLTNDMDLCYPEAACRLIRYCQSLCIQSSMDLDPHRTMTSAECHNQHSL